MQRENIWGKQLIYPHIIEQFAHLFTISYYYPLLLWIAQMRTPAQQISYNEPTALMWGTKCYTPLIFLSLWLFPPFLLFLGVAFFRLSVVMFWRHFPNQVALAAKVVDRFVWVEELERSQVGPSTIPKPAPFPPPPPHYTPLIHTFWLCAAKKCRAEGPQEGPT